MGTIVYRATKDQAVRYELASIAAHARILGHRIVGNRLWFLAEHRFGVHAGTKWVGLTLVDCRNGESAIKRMDETCGPNYFDCPLAFLNGADPPRGDYAGPWREKVRLLHAERSARRAAITKGARVSYAGAIYVLHHCLGRRGWEVLREPDGLKFRMKAGQLTNATLLPVVPED